MSGTAHLFVGLLSGTSMDAVDALVADFSQQHPQIIATHNEPFPKSLKESLLAVAHNQNAPLYEVAQLDVQMGQFLGHAVIRLLDLHHINRPQIIAIGSHGQTICHKPDENPPFTVQIGDPHHIVAITGIQTIADFRRRDIALGGQGAPLTPAFHQAFFSSEQENRAVVNIGGICNATFLYKSHQQPTIGFDTGPGNILLDSWIRYHLNKEYDKGGAWAASGQPNKLLLERMLADPYFQKPAPKSTGREYFNINWAQSLLDQLDTTIEPQDVQATLVQLTVNALANDIQQHLPTPGTVILCGGGAYNDYLRMRLAQQLPNFVIEDSQSYGIPPQWLEAVAFAWFAKQTVDHHIIDLKEITGAKTPSLIGTIYPVP